MNELLVKPQKLPRAEVNRRIELAHRFAKRHDASELATRLVTMWLSDEDSLAFTAALEPYHGTIIVAILWGDVEPA